MSSEQNCADIRRMVAERGWTWNVALMAYGRLAGNFDTIREKLALYGILKEVVQGMPETEVNDAVLAAEASTADVSV